MAWPDQDSSPPKRWRGGMKILASLIKPKRKLERQVGKLGHCAIYEDELKRLWICRPAVESALTKMVRPDQGHFARNTCQTGMKMLASRIERELQIGRWKQYP